MGDIIQFVIQILIDVDDFVVKYECCMCLNAFMKKENININYLFLLEKSMPILMDLLVHFFSPNILWPLIRFLTSLIEKCQNQEINNENNLLNMFKGLNICLSKLYSKDNELIRGAIIDMMKQLIVLFKQETKITPIYMICLDFINFAMQNVVIFLIFLLSFDFYK